jgi:transposase
MYLARRKANDGFIAKQMEQKIENKQKILVFVQEHGKIQNNDVEKLTGVSNATAERYLNELEKEGELTQHGDLTALADTSQSDEFGQLARRFNDMISKLHVAQTEVERYHHEQLARADRLSTIGEMAAKADETLGFSLSQIMFEGPDEELTRTSRCQPALYLHGLMALTLIRERLPDFTPVAAAGLSLGEFTAHAAAGRTELAQGWKIRSVSPRAALDAPLLEEAASTPAAAGWMPVVRMPAMSDPASGSEKNSAHISSADSILGM